MSSGKSMTIFVIVRRPENGEIHPIEAHAYRETAWAARAAYQLKEPNSIFSIQTIPLKNYKQK